MSICSWCLKSKVLAFVGAVSARGYIVNDEGCFCHGWSSLFAFLQAARRSPDQHPLRRARPGAEGDRKYINGPTTSTMLHKHAFFDTFYGAGHELDATTKWDQLTIDILPVLAWQNRSFSFFNPSKVFTYVFLNFSAFEIYLLFVKHI